MEKDNIEVTILMPCLNEHETIGTCIKKAKTFLEKNNINGEVLIADNGSTDDSVDIAKSLGARVISVEKKGYGNALIKGTKEAYGKYVIMGDSDDSYDFLNLEGFVDELRNGADLVMGNRFKGTIEKGAMPFSHRYIGTPIISLLGRILYKSKIGDFNCGLRGCNKEKILSLNLCCEGMEYASEMIIKAQQNNLKVVEIPTNLKKDGRTRAPHLNTIRDGWRHFNFLLINAPRWIFLTPAIIFMVIGLIGIFLLLKGQLVFENFSLGINTMLYCNTFIIVGFQLLIFYLLDRLYCYNEKMITSLDSFTEKIANELNGKYVVLGLSMILIGFIMSISSIVKWKDVNFSELNPTVFMPAVIFANLLLAIGCELVFSVFLVNIIKKR